MQQVSVLVIHNRYQQPGGEDAVVRAETEVLRARGHRVVEYGRDNSEIAGYGRIRKASLAIRAAWNPQTSSELRQLIRRERPDVAHFHNFFPLISPAAHHVCASAGVPVVQTLHNYRLFCSAATLFTEGHICECCRTSRRSPLFRTCYRDSRAQTAAVSLVMRAHEVAGTWSRSVDAYIAPSIFCRDYFVGCGLPQQKVHLKSNFLSHDPGLRQAGEDYALFVGRLSPEKGITELLRAWERLPEVPLLVVGSGPSSGEVQRAAAGCSRITLLGQLSAQQALDCMKRARFLVFPSRWYEPFGMTLLEAAACGVPSIASRMGAIPEIVMDHETGLLFDPENLAQMVEQVRWAWLHPGEMERMGSSARALYLEKFTAEKSYEALMKIYRALLN